MEVGCTDVVDDPDGVLMVGQRVGTYVPLHVTGVERLPLSNYNSQKLNEYVAIKGL